MKSLQPKMQETHKPYSFLKRLKLYAKFLVEAKSWRSIHSPFMFEFAKYVKTSKVDAKKFDHIEQKRRKLFKDQRVITFKDYGASGIDRTRTVAEIAKTSAKAKKQCETLAKMVTYLKPSIGLELGTSLGISYAYMVSASPNTTFTTIEGAKEIAEIASANLSELGFFGNIRVGTFDKHLPSILEELGKVDFVFVDGNHQETRTMDYFNQIVSRLPPNGCIIFDDIYWSQGMTNAWNQIKTDDRVSLSLDCFHFGVVFIREGVDKQHFTVAL